MVETQEQIQKLLQENKDVAEKIKNEIIEKARVESKKLHDKAQGDIEREKEAAIIELKKQVADLAIQAASRLIQVNMDSEKQRDLVNTYIKELDQLDKN